MVWKRIVESCGGSQQAFQMLMLEHLEALSETAAKAISNVKFDKVVVWDGGNGADGTNGASNFLRGLGSSLPPMLQIMKDVGGVEMPEYFGRILGDEPTKSIKPKEKADATDDAEAADGPTETDGSIAPDGTTPTA